MLLDIQDERPNQLNGRGFVGIKKGDLYFYSSFDNDSPGAVAVGINPGSVRNGPEAETVYNLLKYQSLCDFRRYLLMFCVFVIKTDANSSFCVHDDDFLRVRTPKGREAFQG